MRRRCPAPDQQWDHMRPAREILLVLILACTSGAQESSQPSSSSGAATVIPALVPPPQTPVADNRRCFVCHANYEEEQLSVVHAKANVGCVRCHGNSSPHSTDEDGLTAPDRMFPKAHVRLNCLSCHDWVKLVESDKSKVTRTDLEEKPDHEAVLDGRNREKRFCTDCHGEHRMFFRTKGWDRRTGVLLFKDGIPRMVKRSDKG